MRSNKIIIRLILSVSFILAGLILMLNGKQEIRFENINANLYNTEDRQVEIFVSSKLYYMDLAKQNVIFRIPQFFYHKDQNSGKQVYCIQRGGPLNYPSVPYRLLVPVETSNGGVTWQPNTEDGVIKVGTNRFKIRNIDKNVWYPYKNNGNLDNQYSARYRSHVYRYDSSILEKYSGLKGFEKIIDELGNYVYGDKIDIGAKISYIISFQPKKNWTTPKQIAIWLSELGNAQLDGNQMGSDGNDIFDSDYTVEELQSGAEILGEAKSYHRFYMEDYNKNENNLLQDNTIIENIKMEKVKEGNKDYYLIGPYNFNYLGTYSPDPTCVDDDFYRKLLEIDTGHGICWSFNRNIIFGGFANIHLEVKKSGSNNYRRIDDIKYSTDKSNTIEFEFYTPTDNQGNAIDEYVQGSLQYKGDYYENGKLRSKYEGYRDLPVYPDSNQNFYIKVEASKLEGAESVRLAGEYKWVDMDMEKGIVRLNGSGMYILAQRYQTDENGNTILDGNGRPIPRSDFFNITNETNDSFDLEFSIIRADNPEISIQDLIVGEAERILKTIPFSNEFTVQQEEEPKEFDLSLRKYIKSINGKSVNRTKDSSGNLKIDMSNLQNETGTTAVYNFDKNPIEVHKGDTIRYEIKVYNEGNTDGYAKEIIDYLPEGLILKEDSDINRLVGWQELPQNNGETRKKVSTTSLADNRIKAYNGENAENFDRKGKAIQIECVVDPEANIPDNTVLKNVAEIARDLANNTPDIDDRDSNTGDLSTSLSYNGQRPKYEPMDDDEDYEQVLFKNNNVLNLAGYVWDDAKDGKESLADGIFNQSSDPTNKDRALGNIKVTLYYEDRKMVPQSDLKPEEGTEIRYKINPTLTAEDGYYMFCGLDSTKKYYVEYEYDGQKYLPTEHKEYGKTNNLKTSIGAELNNSRETLDNRFAEIKSSPKSYKSKNNLGYRIVDNITFTNLELMGYKLKFEDGKYKYVQEGVQLIDGFLYKENGTTDTEHRPGIISNKINEYIEAQGKYPDENAMKAIYNGIAGNNAELKQKLQFIEDCKIIAQSSQYKNNTFSRRLYDSTNANEDNTILNVNLGLWQRQQFDLHLWKDVDEIDLVVNNKSKEYKYNSVFKKPEGPEINIGNMYDRLMLDENINTNSTGNSSAIKAGENNGKVNQDEENTFNMNNKYHTTHEKKLYHSDYQYLRGNKGSTETITRSDDAQVQIKYKIEIYNESQSVLGEVKEVVDYYINGLTFVSAEASNGITLNVSENQSIYDNGTMENIEGYKKLYITGFDNTKLKSGESIYIYLTFNADMNNENFYNENLTKQNIAEINGFKTYYKDATILPNGVNKNSGNIAGLIDRDSLPGNLTGGHLQGENFAVNLQDDTDMAHAMEFTSENIREINGIVWEDQKVDNSSIGNGKLDNGENGISGITVYLKKQGDNKIAELWNGNKWVTAKTTTGENGEYSFKGFLPGDYYVEFEYGANDLDGQIQKYEKLKKKAQYNGQDYKSTIYTKNINSEYNIANETYKFDDVDNIRVSDAIDNWARREKVNNYSKEQINHIAEVLSSPNRIPAYPKLNSEGEAPTLIGGGNKLEPYTQEQMIKLLEELLRETYMTARTAKIVAEIEHNQGIAAKEETNLSREAGKYIIKNIDFGLIERPTAQLEINKNVENIKVTLSDGTILFDAIGPTTNVGWVKDKFIQISMDKELMHGATIQITYGMTVKNVGEIDYTTKEFYVKGIEGTADQIVTSSAEEVICYVPNNMQFDSEINENKGKWGIISKETIFASTYEEVKTDEEIIQQVTGAKEENKDRVNKNLQKIVERRNAIILTEKLKGDLKPGRSSEEIKLVVSKLISTDTGLENIGNSADDLSYVSVAEIVKIKNTVGRRMKDTILGNQNPDLGQNDKPSEIDAAKGETVIVTPPTGISNVFYYTLTGAVITILAIGIILIKKKVIKK